MNLSILFEKIGSYNEKLDCLYPIYLLFPEIPEYRLVQDEAYFKPLIKKYFTEVNELKKGDLLVFKFLNGFHFGIYEEKGNFFHCCKRHRLRISGLSGYKTFLKDIYRWHHQ